MTEDILLLDEERVLDIFRRIQELGVRVVFDDFGTGYASLSYLKKFPLDGLKIDRSFVIELRADSDDAAIVGSTIGLSEQLGLSVIAEGIENRATADLLVSMGCEHGTGLFLRPADAGCGIRKPIPGDARRHSRNARTRPRSLAKVCLRLRRSRRPNDERSANNTARIESPRQRYLPIFPLAFP